MKIKHIVSSVVFFTLCVLSIHSLAGDEAKPSATGQRIALFDGKTLAGWDLLKCEAEVDNGEILIKAGDGVVQSKKKYSDFIIEFEWKAMKDDNWDSGLYFRYDSIPEGKPWPARYQANLRKGDEGNVGGLKGAKSAGLFKAGEWNSFKLTVSGVTAKMEINGKPAWSAEGLEGPKEGFISLQSEVPNGGQNRFRNIFITELK